MGSNSNERDVQFFTIEAQSMVKRAMITKRFTVVGSNNDDRVSPTWMVRNGIQEFTH